VHANLLASDLVARGGIRGLDFACLGQHLVDLAVRDHYSAGGVGEHVLAGHHAHALEDYWDICLKRGQLVASPLGKYEMVTAEPNRTRPGIGVTRSRM
jgi:hypothetical protein